MPRLIIIAGPNGAGKTTFANEYLSTEQKGFEFVNADEIERELSVAHGEGRASDIEAGRRMLVRINELVERDADFVFETTLANLTYAVANCLPDVSRTGAGRTSSVSERAGLRSLRRKRL